MRGVVEELRLLDQFAPARRRMDVDFDHARIGRDTQLLQPRIARRLVAFEDDRHIQRCRGGFDRGDQLEVVLETGGRRHEDVQPAIARLGAQRGARDPAGGFEGRGAVAGSDCAASLRSSPADRRAGMRHWLQHAIRRQRRKRLRRDPAGCIHG